MEFVIFSLFQMQIFTNLYYWKENGVFYQRTNHQFYSMVPQQKICYEKVNELKKRKFEIKFYEPKLMSQKLCNANGGEFMRHGHTCNAYCGMPS